MFSETRKLNLIEKVLKVDNEEKLATLETVLKKPSIVEKSLKSPFTALSGIWSKEEANEIEKAISESCEQLNLA